MQYCRQSNLMQEKERSHLALTVQFCVLGKLKSEDFVVQFKFQFKFHFRMFETSLRELDTHCFFQALPRLKTYFTKALQGVSCNRVILLPRKH